MINVKILGGGYIHVKLEIRELNEGKCVCMVNKVVKIRL